ncbi:MAG: ribonuclease HII [Candidatus Heimdallarchaeaceae archaeon]
MKHGGENITKQEIIVGIDEAGRGPVIGPLVICAYAIEKEKENLLEEMGAKDSKQLTPLKRKKICKKLIEIAVEYVTIHLSPKEIDKRRKTASLNNIEQESMLEALSKLKINPREIYIDAADVKEKRFGKAFEERFPDAKIVSRHKADSLYPVVSAASIVAKVERDFEIEKIREKIGDEIGSGYPSDPKTREFLKRYYLKHHRFPPFVRQSWDTVNKIREECKKKTLADYF